MELAFVPHQHIFTLLALTEGLVDGFMESTLNPFEN